MRKVLATLRTNAIFAYIDDVLVATKDVNRRMESYIQWRMEVVPAAQLRRDMELRTWKHAL